MSVCFELETAVVAESARSAGFGQKRPCELMLLIRITLQYAAYTTLQIRPTTFNHSGGTSIAPMYPTSIWPTRLNTNM